MTDNPRACRLCGHEGTDVDARVEFAMRRGNDAARQALQLCDLCACSGAACAGAAPLVRNMTVAELSSMLRTVAELVVDEVSELLRESSA